MSMSVPYIPPDYVTPEVDAKAWSGPERRSQDPVDRLARSLNRLCLEATDAYEIVAHLEALGYNTPSALARIGAVDHFKLAEALYARTPKSFARQRPTVRHERNLAAPVAMVLALAVTFGLGAYATASALVAATWVLVWSQVSAALLGRAEGELGQTAQSKVLAVLLRLGLLGLGPVWIASGLGLEAGAPALLWFGVAGLLWGRRFAAAIGLPLLAAAALGATRWWGWPAEVAQASTILTVLAAILPLCSADASGVVPWLRQHAGSALVPAAYGLGQGLLIVSLLRGSPVGADFLPGALLLGSILAVSQALLLTLKRSLTDVLWEQASDAGFVSTVRWRLAGYAMLYVAPTLVAGAVYAVAGAQPWMYHWFAFATLGLALALAVVSFVLGDAVAPGVGFIVAGGLSHVVPFLPVTAILAALLFIWLVRRSAHLERYAVFLV
jgi:hypothetical protein